MKRDWRNMEGYFDPTCGEAMERVEREMREMRKTREKTRAAGVKTGAGARNLDKKRGEAYTERKLKSA